MRRWVLLLLAIVGTACAPTKVGDTLRPDPIPIELRLVANPELGLSAKTATGFCFVGAVLSRDPALVPTTKDVVQAVLGDAPEGFAFVAFKEAQHTVYDGLKGNSLHQQSIPTGEYHRVDLIVSPQCQTVSYSISVEGQVLNTTSNAYQLSSLELLAFLPEKPLVIPEKTVTEDLAAKPGLVMKFQISDYLKAFGEVRSTEDLRSAVQKNNGTVTLEGDSENDEAPVPSASEAPRAEKPKK